MVCSKSASKFIKINSNHAFRECLVYINLIPIALSFFSPINFSTTVVYLKSENDTNFVIKI